MINSLETRFGSIQKYVIKNNIKKKNLCFKKNCH